MKRAALLVPLALLAACNSRTPSPTAVVDQFFSALERNDLPAARALLSGNLSRLDPALGQTFEAWEAGNKAVFRLMKHRTLDVEALNMGGTGVSVQVTTIDARRTVGAIIASSNLTEYDLATAPTMTLTPTLEMVKSQDGRWLIYAWGGVDRLISGLGWP